MTSKCSPALRSPPSYKREIALRRENVSAEPDGRFTREEIDAIVEQEIQAADLQRGENSIPISHKPEDEVLDALARWEAGETANFVSTADDVDDDGDDDRDAALAALAALSGHGTTSYHTAQHTYTRHADSAHVDVVMDEGENACEGVNSLAAESKRVARLIEDAQLELTEAVLDFTATGPDGQAMCSYDEAQGWSKSTQYADRWQMM